MAYLFGRDYTKAELLRLVGDMSQLAAVRRAELTEGNQRGAGLIEVSNALRTEFLGAARTGARYRCRHLPGAVAVFP